MIHNEQIFSDPDDSPFNRGQYQGVDPIFQSDPDMLDGEVPAPAAVAIQGGGDEKSEDDSKDADEKSEDDSKDAEGKADDAKPAADDAQKAPAPVVPAAPNKK